MPEVSNPLVLHDLTEIVIKPRYKQENNKQRFLEMEIDQLNQTLEDFQDSIRVYKQLVVDLIEPKNDKALLTFQKELDRAQKVNSDLRVE